MDIPSYHLNFVNEEYDENGILKKFSIKYPDNFNFAYDIIDKYGEMEPTAAPSCGWISRATRNC